MLQNISAATLRRAAEIKDRISELETQLSSMLNIEPEYNHKLLPLPKRRRMSPQARAKIAAAARLRWSKAKHQGRNHL